eukprot:SAG31_NODE_10733_length_1104_cov_1.195025_1_plen_144_part_10
MKLPGRARLSWLAAAALLTLLFLAEQAEAKKKKKKHIDDDFVISDKDMQKPEKKKKLTKGKNYKRTEMTVQQDLITVRKIEDPLERIDKLEKLIVQKPAVPEYYLERGEAKQAKKFTLEAIKDYDKAVDLYPDFEGVAKMTMLQ